MHGLIVILLATTLTATTGSKTIRIDLPEGWREVRQEEIARLQPDVVPQNEAQRRLKTSSARTILLAMKRDLPEPSVMSATVMVFSMPMHDSLHGASSLELARVLAFSQFVAFGQGKYEVEPREITVAGKRAAEWSLRYRLVEAKSGAQEMFSRAVVIADSPTTAYLIGFTGPAAATAEAKTFDDVLRSVKLHGK